MRCCRSGGKECEVEVRGSVTMIVLVIMIHI